MVITLFHRATTDEYPPPCDVAGIAVFDSNDQPAGFIGSDWGDHPDPQDCLHWAIIEDDAVDATLASWGVHRAPAPPIGDDA